MSNNYFRFKQFTVFHDKCAMKVGTDGVLLGAWSNFDNCQSILDVGTGSGLVALMAAQKNSCAKITAIEIDKNAALQAKDNVEKSPFGDKIKVLHISFRDFVSSETAKFDLIVSNPPFFVDSLLPPDSKRAYARHTHSLPSDELLKLSKKILNENGKLSLIYPFSETEKIKSVAEKENLHLLRQTSVSPTVSSGAKRVLLEFGIKSRDKINKNELVIEKQRHVYTPEFIELTRDFYLHL